jgi:hypothetical protein
LYICKKISYQKYKFKLTVVVEDVDFEVQVVEDCLFPLPFPPVPVPLFVLMAVLS